MKRKASVMALDDLYNTILKSSLLGSLDVKPKKSNPIKELLNMDEDEDEGEDEDGVIELGKSDKTPKVIEFSVTRMGKIPSKRVKKSSNIDADKEAQDYFKKKIKRR